jgi:peptidoglycan hydrolase-like protein with peptidoglycan-binding domain
MARRVAGAGRVAATGVAVVLAATGGTGWWLSQRGHGRPAGGPAVAVATATVVRADLATTTQLGGSLGYAGNYPVVARDAGTVTALPRPGQVISRGQPLYEVAGRPVRLLYGARPAWRALAPGVSDGPDVAELEQNLLALGHADLTPDNHFTGATAAGLRRWQHATGQPVTGVLAPGAVAFEPGPVRIGSVAAALGTPLEPGAPVLTATSTTVVVTVAVPAAQAYLVHAQDPVTVTLPDGKAVAGTVTEVSSAATAPAAGAGDRPAPPTVAATVTLAAPVAGLDQAPVMVAVVSQAVRGALAVPVTALVALAGGGYGVYLRADGQRRLVAVTAGIFANTLVEIREGLKEGDVVEVPAG